MTLIVARRFEQLFRTRPPAIKEWERYGSLKECLDDLRDAGQPIDYVFDDHLHHLAAQLLEHEREYRRLGYVVTGAEEHYAYARVLVTCCDEVLVEKPISKLVRDIEPAPDGRFHALCKEVARAAGELGEVYSCDHFMFRKGFTDARDRLKKFIERHRRHGLHYHFSFFETATRDALRARPAAMQDGSLLDVAIAHGLGPFVYLLRCTGDLADAAAATRPGRTTRSPHLERFDGLHRAVTWTEVEGFQAREREDPRAPLVVPVLAETAVRVAGNFRRGRRKIELTLEAGKGAAKRDRFVRIKCRACTGRVRKSGRPADSVFFGISLGTAGYTVCDYAGRGDEEFAPWEHVRHDPDHPLKAPEFDGGWRSDRAGGNVEAEVAQAAMLEAFIAPGFDDRFIPVPEACQIVRLGMEAQALAFCRRRPAYTLGHDFGSDENERKWPQWPKAEKTGARQVRKVVADHGLLKERLWPAGASAPGGEEPVPGNARGGAWERLLHALAPLPAPPGNDEHPPSRYRVLSVLGPEGFGNTDTAASLARRLRKLEQGVHLIQIPRDEQWCLDRGSGTATEDRLVHDLVVALGIGSASLEDPAADLLGRIVECRADLAGERRVLILNGVDRLGDQPWQDLVALLNQLPDSHRLVFVTNRGDRAAGPVFETAELVADPLEDEDRQVDRKSHRDELRSAVEGLVGKPDPQAEAKGDWAQRDVYDSIERLAGGNITVERQLILWLRHVVVPNLARRSEDRPLRPKEPDDDLLAWRRAWGALAHEMSTLNVPRTITPFPERLLDRLSLACLAAVDESDRNAVAALARLSDGAPNEAVHLAFPGLAARICAPGPLRSLFRKTGYPTGTRYVLFPRVRRAAVQAFETALREDRPAGEYGKGGGAGDPTEPRDAPRREELRLLVRELDDRRLLLALPEEAEYNDARLDRLLALGERGIHGLGKLDLDGTLMEDLCLALVDAIEIGLRGRIDLRPGRLLRLLIERPTNLGMLTRSRLLSLIAWAGLSRTRSPAQVVQIMNRLADAGRVADGCGEFERALHELHRWKPETESLDDESREKRRADSHRMLRAESHLNLVVADLFRTQSWFELLGVDRRSGYVFEQEASLIASREAMKEFIADPRDGDKPAVRRLRAKLLVVLGLDRARGLTGRKEPPDAPTGRDPRKQFKAAVADLEDAIRDTRKALGINQALADSEAEAPLPDDARKGACRNRLNLALLHCSLLEQARRAGLDEEAENALQAAKTQISEARKMRAPGDGPRCSGEPYYALVVARARQLGVPVGGAPTPVRSAEEAEQGYRRRGQEYFAEMTAHYGRELKKREKPTPAAGDRSGESGG